MNCKKAKNILVRFVSVICVIVLCFAFLVGCDTDTDEELERLKTDLSEVNKELASIKEEYEKVLQEKNALSDANDAASREIETLKSEKAGAAQEIATLKSDNDSAKLEIESLKGENASAKLEIEALKGENASAKLEIESLKADNETVKQELDVLKIEHETMLKELGSVKGQLKDLMDQIASDPSEEKIRIYIDQGHNPTSQHNSGAVGNGLYEENLTFTVGRLLAGLLTLDGRFEVCLSRPTASTVLGTDNTSSLEARVEGAKEFEADYFISLHVNSYPSLESVSGIEIWVTELEGEAYDLGNSVRAELAASTGLKDRGMKKDEKPLHVLKNATMPAILVEMGFITNPEDAALLDQSPDLFANGIYNGILAYFNFQKLS